MRRLAAAAVAAFAIVAFAVAGANAEVPSERDGYVVVVPGPGIPFAADPPATVVVLKVSKAWCDLHGGVWARHGEGVCLDIDY